LHAKKRKPNLFLRKNALNICLFKKNNYLCTVEYGEDIFAEILGELIF